MIIENLSENHTALIAIDEKEGLTQSFYVDSYVPL